MRQQPDDVSLLSLPRTIHLRDCRSVVLRVFHQSDAEQVCRILPLAHRESDFLNWLSGEFDWTVEREREFIRDHTDRRGTIIVCGEAQGRIVGGWILMTPGPDFGEQVNATSCAISMP